MKSHHNRINESIFHHIDVTPGYKTNQLNRSGIPFVELNSKNTHINDDNYLYLIDDLFYVLDFYARCEGDKNGTVHHPVS